MRQAKLVLVFLGLLFFIAACTPPAENNRPVATAQTVSTEIGKAVTITLKATDTESDALTFKIVANPTKGSLSELSGAKKDTVVYTPSAGFTGQDSFTFTASDAGGASNTAKVTVNVNAAGNNAPVATDGTADVAAGGSVKVTLAATDADSDPLSFTLGTPSAGTVVKDADFDTSRSVTYTAAAGAAAGSTATFDFTVTDGKGGSDTGTITVTIAAASGKVTNDTYSTFANTLLEAGGIAASGNAAVTDAKKLTDNDTAKTITAVASKATSQGGTVEIKANGSFSYAPKAGFVGSDTFTYAAGADTATVTVDVKDANATLPENQVAVYVKADAAPNGDGTSAKPLQSLLSAMSASKAGDIIVLYAGTYIPADNAKYGIQLKSNQRLLGQEADVSIEGTTVLKANSVTKTILSKPANVTISLADYNDDNKKNIVVSFQANDVTISGLTINRANAAGNATADLANGPGQSGIITTDQMTGTLTLTDINILYPGGFGFNVTETDRCPHVNCDAKFENLGPVGTSTARYNLIMKRVKVTGAGNTPISINDPISVDIDASDVVGVGTKESGFLVESEHITSVKITNSTVTSTAVNSVGFEFLSNNNFGRTSEKAVMTVELADNFVKFIPNAANDKVSGDPPVATPDGRVDGTVGYEGRVLDNWDDELKVISVSPGSSQAVLKGTSKSEAADSRRACVNITPPYDAAIPTPVTCGDDFIITQTVPGP